MGMSRGRALESDSLILIWEGALKGSAGELNLGMGFGSSLTRSLIGLSSCLMILYRVCACRRSGLESLLG